MNKLKPPFHSRVLGRILTAQGLRTSPIAPQVVTARTFATSRNSCARRVTPRYRVHKETKLAQDPQKECQEEVCGVEAMSKENAELLGDMTEEQKSFLFSEEFLLLRSEYPAINLHMKVPPSAPGASIEKYIDDIAMDLAVDIHVAKYPPDALQSPAGQTKFVEEMMVTVTKHMETITEGLRTGFLGYVKKSRSGVSVFD